MPRRRKRHGPEQIIRKLRDADAMLAGGKTIGEVCQALEVAEATFHRWRNQSRRLCFSLARRSRTLSSLQNNDLRRGIQQL